MKIVRIDLLRVRMPFRLTFRHALASRSEGESVIVRVHDADGATGYGECVPRTYVTGESPETVWRALSGRLPAPLSGACFDTFGEVAEALSSMLDGIARHEQAAFCALELAVLDLAGRCFGVSAGSVLGPVARDRVAYSGVLSADGPDVAQKTCAAFRTMGFRAVKAKVGEDLEANLALLRTARSILGDAVSLRVDANCAWSFDEARRQLEALAEVGLDGVEQPLSADDIDSLAALTAESPIRIILDETLASAEDARRLIDVRACHCFNIRISKCGGLLGSGRIRDLAVAGGVECMLGAQVGETALLSAAGRQFATRSNNVVFCEGSYGTLLLEQDIGTEDLTIGAGGFAPALTGPGLGVDVDAGVLAAATTEECTVS